MSLSSAEAAPLIVHLASVLAGARLQDVRQPDAESLVLSLRSPGATIHLLLAVGAGRARLHTVERPPPNPRAPLAFQNLLRARLAGGVVALRQVQADRIVRIDFDDSGAGASLVLEFTDRRGNLFLLDEGGDVVGALVSSGAARRLPLGQPYEPPPPRPGAAPDRSRWSDLPVERLDAAIGAHYASADSSQTADQLRLQLARVLRARVKKLGRLAQRQMAEAERGDLAAELRVEGDLLRAAFGQLRRGLATIAVRDFYSEPGATRVIDLDPALGPSEQVDARYRRARRYERAGERALANWETTEERLGQARADLESVERADGAGLVALAERLGLDPASKAARAKTAASRRPERRSPYRAWRTPAGAEIRVGRSASDNDRLTLHESRGRDVWMHVRGQPGAHVVIRDPGSAPPLELLLLGAQLACKHSGISDGARVEVAWTHRKHVDKPKGWPPGRVRVTQERVLYVEADAAALVELTPLDPPR